MSEAISTVLTSIAVLVLGTQVSEDLTCVTAAEAIRRGAMPWTTGIIGCFIGILLGDLLLWAIGRAVGRRLLRWRWMKRRLAVLGGRTIGRQLDRNLAALVLGSRFVPGTRLPLYLAMGALGRRPLAFASFATLAAAVWTPLLIASVVFAGRTVAYPLQAVLGAGLMSWCALVIGGLVLLRLASLSLTPGGRSRVGYHFARWRRWEFWPSCIAYLPVLLWIAWLSIRHRGFSTVLHANPGIPLSGFVGESKHAILRKLRSSHVSPSTLIARGDVSTAKALIECGALKVPIILKPDVGQRGAGVRLARSVAEVERYVRLSPVPTIIQAYHAGPFEAGIFYVRLPNQPHGRIFSVTDKAFPDVAGDGRSTLRELVLAHPRLRLQAARFFQRHARSLDEVIPLGELRRLALAGNHCQGTLFRDGSHLITPELERAIDEVARTFDGFYFGRFDVRYGDVDAFRAGQDFCIIELNGLTSESTNVYDPSWSIRRRYRVLFAQWRLAFQIGAINRAARRERGPTIRELIGEVLSYYRGPKADELSA
ncbi:MAG: hypothetical protein QM770_04995 [Tepidisphaeraceae bacterium]